MKESTIITFFRSFIIKILTRYAIYGFSWFCGTIGIDNVANSTSTEQTIQGIIQGVTALIFFIIGGYIDKLHQKADRKE